MAIDSIPNDVEALKALLVTAWQERDAVRTERDVVRTERDIVREERDVARQEREYAKAFGERLLHLLRQLKRAHYGRKSERLDADQYNLALEDLEAAVAKAEAHDDKVSPERRRERTQERRRNRGALPEHFERLHVTLAPQDTACSCCSHAMHIIGEDTSERLDIIPAQYRVIVTHRPKYGCRSCGAKIVQAHATERLIKGGLPTEAVVASVLVDKYADHCPLYRQAQIMARQGLNLDRSTLASWVGHAACELEPVYRRLKDILLASGKIAVDETKVPVLDPGRGRTKAGYFWSIARDDRPWGGNDPPGAVYTYAPGRGAIYAHDLLASYRGIVQCDGYAAYKSLDASRITLAFCWTHARRKFFEIAKVAPMPLAEEALARIAAFYEIEKSIRGHSPEARCAVRQEKTKPLIEAFQSWLEHNLALVSAKSTLAQAMQYALNHWDGLVRFLDDGRIELDTNIVERSIRGIVLNRKNALFAGHDEGAENWATIASLIETCKLSNVNPQTYLADVLTKLVNLWPMSKIDDLMPWAWGAAANATEQRAP